MKTIYLVRHAKAVTRREDLSDYYRPLKKKGKNDSYEMMKKFTELKIVPDLLISSPATRALETAKIFAEGLNYDEKNIKLEESIYFALSGDKFSEFVNKCDKECDSVMIFGHEPTFSEFAGFLIKDFNYGFPKTAVLAIQFNVNEWSDIDPGTGIQKFFLMPEDKKLEDYKLY